MNAVNPVFWNGELLGQLHNFQTDHGYLEGDITFESGEIAEKFVAALNVWLDGKSTLRERFDALGRNMDKAVWVSLREHDAPTYFVWHIENVETQVNSKAHLAMKLLVM